MVEILRQRLHHGPTKPPPEPQPLIPTATGSWFAPSHAGTSGAEFRPMISSTSRPFRNREQAGRVLAEHLKGYADRSDVIVLALLERSALELVHREP